MASQTVIDGEYGCIGANGLGSECIYYDTHIDHWNRGRSTLPRKARDH